MPSSKGEPTDPKLREEIKEEVKDEEKGTVVFTQHLAYKTTPFPNNLKIRR